MGKFTNGLRESADDMIETADYINKGADYIDKGAKIAEYWLNGDKRKAINAQVAMWKRKNLQWQRGIFFFGLLWLVVQFMFVWDREMIMNQDNQLCELLQEYQNFWENEKDVEKISEFEE